MSGQLTNQSSDTEITEIGPTLRDFFFEQCAVFMWQTMLFRIHGPPPYLRVKISDSEAAMPLSRAVAQTFYA